MAEEGTPREHQRGQLRTGAVTPRRASPSARAGFRARGFPGVPAVPASSLDGKEGVDGSSPPSRRDARRRVYGRGNGSSRADPARGSRGSPPAPANPRITGLRKPCSRPQIPADPRSARKRHDRPVTPEVAGSSRVAPVENILQMGSFCCRFWRNRPPASQPVKRSSRTRFRTRFGHIKRCKSHVLWLGGAPESSLIPRRSRKRADPRRRARAWAHHPARQCGGGPSVKGPPPYCCPASRLRVRG
jgi:hypothetical protein